MWEEGEGKAWDEEELRKWEWLENGRRDWEGRPKPGPSSTKP